MAREGAADPSEGTEDLSPSAMRKLIQELRTHQIELEMQNNELRRSRAALDTAQARYFDFYDLAPVGYVSVSEQGLILHANLTTASLLGVARSKLAKQAFSRFIERQDQDRFYLLHQQLREPGTAQSCELHMVKQDGSHFFIRMEAIATHGDDGAPELRLVLVDITRYKISKEALRIAAVAFEVQEAIVVMDSQRRVLRVNRAFTHITGYSEQDMLGKTTAILRSRRAPESFYEDVWRETVVHRVRHDNHWLQRKSGEEFFARYTLTAISNEQDQITHFLVTFSDETLAMQQKQQRLQHEATQREALVGEVHHRIKNNLQGMRGLLQQIGQQKPEIAEQMHVVMGHLQGVSVIHGLQGRRTNPHVRLCELTHEIAKSASALWQTPIPVAVPSNWIPRIVAEKEAVALALVLNELIVNAIKHGGKPPGQVSVTLQPGQGAAGVEVTILNTGQLHDNRDQPKAPQHGLQLIKSLLPQMGVDLALTQCGDQVCTLLKMNAPVLALDMENRPCPPAK